MPVCVAPDLGESMVPRAAGMRRRRDHLRARNSGIVACLPTWYLKRMDSTLLARITASHARRLAWFEDHEGGVTALPEPLSDGLFLVSTPKGIYKPGDIPYA